MRIAALLLVCCVPEPAAPRPAVDPLIHRWLVYAHELSSRTLLSEDDALSMYGREVAITATGYTTPWHGTCDEASRARTTASLVKVTADSGVAPEGRERLARSGLSAKLDEYRLSCHQSTVPPLTIWVAGDRAMTCFGGACYLLSRS